MTLKETTAELDRKIGEALRAFRVSRGMSQEKLAKALNVTFQQVQKYEKGTNRVSASALILAAGALGVSPVDLLPGPMDDAPAESSAIAGIVAEHHQMKTRLARIRKLTAGIGEDELVRVSEVDMSRLASKAEASIQ